MFKTLFATAVFVLVQSASAQSNPESSSSPCELVSTAIQANSKWTGEMVKFCGSKLIVVNHGFDLSCLNGLSKVQSISKEQLGQFKNYISVFAVREVESGIELQYTRTTNGINQPMEYVLLKK